MEEKVEPLTLVTEIKLHTWIQYKAGVIGKKDVKSILKELESIGPDDTIDASLKALEEIKEDETEAI